MTDNPHILAMAYSFLEGVQTTSPVYIRLDQAKVIARETTDDYTEMTFLFEGKIYIMTITEVKSGPET